MSEYSKRTVADLQEILKSRNLPTSGKKADLIARLSEADKAATSNAAEQEPEPEPVAEQPAPVVTTEVSTQPPPSTAQPEGQANGQAAEESTADTGAAAAEEKTFALHLAASDVDREMEKRKARAERFKTGGEGGADAGATETATVDTDALKNLERAKRFGTGTTAIGLLDSALSSERERGPRGKKRDTGADENTTMDDPGLKSSFNRHGRNGRDKRRRGTPGAKPTGVSKPTNAALSEKDRQAAEARKKRFAAAS